MTIRDLYDQFELQGHIIVKSFDDKGENEKELFFDTADRLYRVSDVENIMDADITFMYSQYEHGTYGEVYSMIVIEVEEIEAE